MSAITPEQLMTSVDRAIQRVDHDWDTGQAEDLMCEKIHEQMKRLRISEAFNPECHQDELTLINIWKLRKRFMNALTDKHGDDVGEAAYATIVSQLEQYSETLENGHASVDTSPVPPKPKPTAEEPSALKGNEDTLSLETPEPEKSIPATKQDPLLPEKDETCDAVKASPAQESSLPSQDPVGHELTPEERDRFNVLNEKVGKGIAGVIEAGMALVEIRKNKLYRGKHATFVEYLQNVHSMSKTYAYNLMKSGNTALEMFSIEDEFPDLQVPNTESKLRELSRVKDPVKRYEIVAEVIDEKGPEYTAADLAKKIKVTLGTATETDVPKPPSPKKLIDLISRDFSVLAELLAEYDLDEECRQLVEKLQGQLAA